jgi:periplasmic divalent cation tolerance protein
MNQENQYLVVLCTCPDEVAGARIAEAVVVDGLAACVNRVPGVVSTFRWKGEVQEEREVLLVIKTSRGRLDSLTDRIRDLHPYELPEVVAVPVTGGLDEYLAWVGESVS